MSEQHTVQHHSKSAVAVMHKVVNILGLATLGVAAAYATIWGLYAVLVISHHFMH